MRRAISLAIISAFCTGRHAHMLSKAIIINSIDPVRRHLCFIWSFHDWPLDPLRMPGAY